MNPVTQPLGLKRYLSSSPPKGFDLVPYFDAVLIALIVALNSAHFISAPGASIDLVRLDRELSSVASPGAVLTIDRNELYFFQGQKLLSASLADKLKVFVDESRLDQPVLLIKADRSIPTESLFGIFELAKTAGFVNVHLAAEGKMNAGQTWSRGKE